MSDTSFLYTFESPLKGYENLEPLPSDKAPDGKSLLNPPPQTPSEAYTTFPFPIQNGQRGGFDIHVYFLQTDAAELEYATALHERIRREFPELRIYSLHPYPLGPHPIGMFEVNVFTPQQFGAFIPWLVIHRGMLSALVHPNTDEEVRDHSQRATWMGPAVPLRLGVLREMERKKAEGDGA